MTSGVASSVCVRAGLASVVTSTSSNEVYDLEGISLAERELVVRRALAKDHAVVLDDHHPWIERKRSQQIAEGRAGGDVAFLAIHDDRRGVAMNRAVRHRQ